MKPSKPNTDNKEQRFACDNWDKPEIRAQRHGNIKRTLDRKVLTTESSRNTASSATSNASGRSRSDPPPRRAGAGGVRSGEGGGTPLRVPPGCP